MADFRAACMAIWGTKVGIRNCIGLARERKARDLDQVKCIEDEEGKVLVDEISVARGGDIVLNDLASKGVGTLDACRCFRIEEVIRLLVGWRGRRPGQMRLGGFLEEADKAV
ncbi:hypothetical protein H5410_008887 [Solanum commersonii]|uniref:Uncharacterized protein n=1 Tax=Solanum commersonii TaxID=4109 RepID=A0A9J6AG88_SOLCO|nr:hypothetical protein H5410_008887 [Solanum commersonii]